MEKRLTVHLTGVPKIEYLKKGKRFNKKKTKIFNTLTFILEDGENPDQFIQQLSIELHKKYGNLVDGTEDKYHSKVSITKWYVSNTRVSGQKSCLGSMKHNPYINDTILRDEMLDEFHKERKMA